jgi:NifU-like protein involved in Fe-S cluster formation
VTEGVVRAVAFQAFGCPHTLAAASLVAERLEGQPFATAREFDVRAVCAPLDVPIEKAGKLLRIEDAVQQCWRELTTRT